jgi:hypothetical protein
MEYLGGLDQMEKVDAKQVCHHHMHRYVRVVIVDGRSFDGFVDNVDDNHLHLAVPVGHEMYCDHMENASIPNENMAPVGGCGCNTHLPSPYGTQQGYGNPSFGSSGYPGVDVRAFVPGYYPPGFGYNPYGRRRFNRLLLPLVALTAISVLPFY